ncbi:MAG: hypothetical protein V1775_16915 [Bacteroidota bacterium]
MNNKMTVIGHNEELLPNYCEIIGYKNMTTISITGLLPNIPIFTP